MSDLLFDVMSIFNPFQNSPVFSVLKDIDVVDYPHISGYIGEGSQRTKVYVYDTTLSGDNLLALTASRYGVFCARVLRENAIFATHQFIETLTEEELKSLLFHEMGHILNGDLEGVDAGCDGKVQVLSLNETAADETALKLGASKHALKSGLISTTRCMFAQSKLKSLKSFSSALLWLVSPVRMWKLTF